MAQENGVQVRFVSVTGDRVKIHAKQSGPTFVQVSAAAAAAIRKVCVAAKKADPGKYGYMPARFDDGRLNIKAGHAYAEQIRAIVASDRQTGKSGPVTVTKPAPTAKRVRKAKPDARKATPAKVAAGSGTDDATIAHLTRHGMSVQRAKAVVKELGGFGLTAL